MNLPTRIISLALLLLWTVSGQAAPVIDPIASVSIPAGESLILPITAASPSGLPLTYTVTSSTSAIAVVMHTNNPFWQLTVSQAASAGAPGAYQTPFRGGLVTVTNIGTMTFMLFPEYAPHTVNVFQGLTYSGFYNSNTIFHRVISNFVIQGGDPLTNGVGGLTFQYQDEFHPQAIYSGNGQLALANSGKDTDSSQFFVTAGAQRELDFQYPIFGQLVRGFEVLTNVSNTAVTNDRPRADVIIQQAAFVTNTTDTVLTLTATNLANLAGTITVIADDGAGGRTTNAFSAVIATNNLSTGRNQPFIYENTVTNLVAPVNTTLTNFLNAYEMRGDLLYWYPQFGDYLSYANAINSTDAQTNSQLKTLTYNLTNQLGQFELFVVPATNYIGRVIVYFFVSSGINWNPNQPSITNYDQQEYTFIFGDTPITARSNMVNAVAGVPVSNAILATFTNGVAGSAATNFSAYINWGDNSTNTASVVANAAGLKGVLGSHTYPYPGSYPVYVSIVSSVGVSATVLSFINVSTASPATSVLTVQSTGQGTVDSGFNNASLGVGQSYSVTASPAFGWALDSWTDGNGFVLSTSPHLTFTMSPNLSLTAKFTPIIPPTVTIVSPANGVVTNLFSALTTVTGTATNNGAITSIWYQANSGNWQQATGTNNWSASFAPAFGVTNTFQVYAINNLGYYSTTNTLRTKYLPGGILTLITNGLGTITPVLNTNLLPFGTNYTLTAVPASGFSFTGWTGGLATNKTAIRFSLAANLTLQANFVNNAKPALVISNLVSGQRVTNSLFTVRGKASDSWVVGNVKYQLNNSGWTNATGTTSWSAALNLVPGTNVFQVYAVDGNGTASATNTYAVDYVVPSPLQLLTTGLGTISPNYSNAVLEIGKNYVLTATPKVGFAFTNWTGGLATNKPTLTFAMASNLSLTANFVDVTRPLLAITNLTANQRVSNSVFTVRGTASDNLQPASVQYQLNGNRWSSANGLTNWSANLNLLPGTNVLQVFAVDSTGNYSITNTIKPYFVLSAQLQLLTTGRGTITPNYSNAFLEVGKNYTLTAVPAAGFTFTNWTGSLATNRAALSFTMASNLSFTANFVDVTRPLISITNLTAGQRVSNSLFTVRGTASDNLQLAGVQYQLNSNGWTNATGTTAWSADLNLIPGTNVLQIFAYDTTGNTSLTNTIKPYYVLSAPLQLMTTGKGTITPNYSNALLEVGKNYTVTAAPAIGFLFSNWTGSLSTNKAALSFTMASNLSFTANFVDVTRPLLTITNLATGQRVSNSLFTVRGSASDNLQLAGVQYQLNSNGWNSANGLTNWSADLNLVPGTNLLQVFAYDSTGNTSLTNTIKPYYALTARLQLQLSGRATISPNYSNAVLEVGKNYTVTATPASGWVFYNWLDGSYNGLTNRATLNFTMSSNLVLIANIHQLPVIQTQPTNVLAFYGGNANFSVVASGTDPLGYQWQRNSLNLSGQNDSTINLPMVNVENAGSYRVIVSSYSQSVTSSVAKLSLTNAPTSLAGFNTIVTPSDRSPLQVSFATNTFGLFTAGTNAEPGVGNYEYVPSGILSGQLSLLYLQPPLASSNDVQTIDLTFVSPGWAVFTNGDSSGTIQYFNATNLVPAVWGNHKITLTATNKTFTLSLSTAGSFSVVISSAGTPNVTATGFFTASAYSRVAGLLRLTEGENGPHYVQLQFSTTTTGNYIMENYDLLNNLTDEQSGTFKFQ